ncbi:SusC/RagA family TonB-linked outer membrane protein [Rhodocytophaga rosea]|uniref:SusC/RagA family TonB-linked outer membrane protein n=1 Tax=Rhodocytophaga rosea TaxID=2704465 RepID=A0A6C0GDT3_9BACT|nr:SusC/RagA family TonB-linked outer membrane protein [Rhodocytophaga rosea]QHT65984.1 SusC/RagA family TonB-linked outer membrane protein [Rhodocytophaga rosea]
MKRNLLIGLLFTLCVLQQAWAQTRTVTGTVRGATDKSPLPGVNVVIKGTTSGTTTNLDGQYSLPVPENATLVFSFIGFSAQEVLVGNRAVIDLQMEEDVTKLTEVVVTAVGIQREKASLGYAVQEVKGNMVTDAREPNIVNALAGKIAGVQINSSGGQPGSSSRITIRGNSSVLGNNQPLFVVDGIPVDNSQNFGGGQLDGNGRGNGDSPLFNGSSSNRGVDLDPNIIESISVLKGAAASALYGSRAANGVILITTKTGKAVAGKKGHTISFNTTMGWDEARIAGFQDKYLQGLNGKYRNGEQVGRGGYSEEGANLDPRSTRAWGPHIDSVSQAVIDSIGRPQLYDPRKDFFQTGRSYDNSINISGGNEMFNYFTSYSDFRQTGIVPNSEFKRHSFLAKAGVTLSEKLKATASINYVKSYNQWLTEGNGARSYLYGLYFTPPSYNIRPYRYEDGSQRNFSANFNNPLWLAENNNLSSDVDRFIANTTLTYQVLPWLSITERVGLDTYLDSRKEKVNIGTVGRLQGSMYDENLQWREVNSDLIVTANKTFSSDFNATFMLGNNINSRFLQRELQRGTGLNIPGFYNIQNAALITASENTDQRRLIGIYAQATFDYRSMIFLTLTGRNDWSSTLPKGENSYFYPSASLGFVFTEPLGLTNSAIFPFGKLRMSYAAIGNDAPTYSLTSTYSQSNPGDGQRGNIQYPFQGINGFELTNIQGNPNLKPERTTEFEIGLDLQFLRNRFRIDAAYYKRRSVDQIFPVPVSPATGFIQRLTNSGEISNEGLELVVGGTPVKAGDFSWDAQIVFTKNVSKVVALAPGVETIRLGGFTSPSIFIKEGEKYGVIWGQGFKRNEQGKLLIDEDGLPVLSDALGAIGNIQPDWTSGIRNTFSWKGLSLSALVDIRKGGDILNFDQYYSTFYGTAKITEARNTTIVYDGVSESTGEPNTIPVLRDQNYWQNFYSLYDENFVEDGSFIKVRDINLSYALPQTLLSKTPFRSLRVSAIGRNLFIKSDFSYADPEGSLYGSSNAQGFYHSVTPGSKSYTVGLSATF